MSNTPFSISDIYAENVFNDGAMRKYLPGDTYKQLKRTIDMGLSLDSTIAESVANGMKQWALSKGATHYTHWFQPMTGATAEKHDSFINPLGDGTVIMTFSGKELIRSEADASSFPSGGLRATFEARGYTMWDCTSPAFLKGNTLCVPTCFCSFTGEVLDKKTPLLRSMEVLAKNAKRVVDRLGVDKCTRVMPMAGAEQEYFLIDKDMFHKRLDIMQCGRTLFGASPQKGQELGDHYYGNIKEKVADFMQELNTTLWKLGVSAKTEHNEAAPCQHELAPVYTTCNIACDNNQLIMEIMKKTAHHHGMVCLLHEKPFARINGSGKHNNWSINIDSGKSLFKQGKNPEQDVQFLLFVSAVIWAVDDYAQLLRATTAGAGNDHRLGGHEAPPAIISIFLGETLTNILEQIEQGNSANQITPSNISMGINTIPELYADNSDRNRTSPFAFTGNKFEFRMPGASQSIADCNTVINTAVADVLGKIADRLDRAEDVGAEALKVIADIMAQHKHIIFNGNNYTPAWVEEAARRGLPNLVSTVDAVEGLVLPASVQLFEKFGILSKKELESRADIRYENYSKTLTIEALTLMDIIQRDIMPSVMEYQTFLAGSAASLKGMELNATVQLSELQFMEYHLGQLDMLSRKLTQNLAGAALINSARERARFMCDNVVETMEKLRTSCDFCEAVVPSKMWTLPRYTDLLYNW